MILTILTVVKNVIFPMGINSGLIMVCLICIYLMGPIEYGAQYINTEDRRYFMRKLSFRLAEVAGSCLILFGLNQETYLEVIGLTMFAIVISMVAGKCKLKWKRRKISEERICKYNGSKGKECA